MSDKKKPISLSWEDFQGLGDPSNAPDDIIESQEDEKSIDKSERIRIYLDRKHRRGKSVSLITGLENYDDDLLKTLGKVLKKLCGVGGNVKNGEIIIQGDNRDKIMDYFKKEGFKDVKKSGG